MKIKISELEALVKKVLCKEYNAEYTNLIADVLLYAELSGKPSHGLLRLLKENYGVFVEHKQGNPVLIHKSKISTIIDGKGNSGMLVGPLAMQEAIRLGQEHDIGIVGTKDSINTTGVLSYYAEKIAEADLIAMVFSQSTARIAAFDSKKALFGTNPFAFGIPSKPEPFVFDMAASAITFGAIVEAQAENRPLPPDVAIDTQGNVTTDPQKALHGAILPFDKGYKGSALAMIVEILGSLWPGAGFATLHQDFGWGNLYMAFSPNLLLDIETFKSRMHELIEKVRHTETRDGKKVRIPQENSRNIRKENLKRGEIEIDAELYQKISALILS